MNRALGEELQQVFASHPQLVLLQELICQQGGEAWLVGGALRDLWLARPLTDLDLALPTDPTPLARAWARRVAARWFWLDADRQQSRVLLPGGLTIDFAPLRAATIFEDLLLRDFTINALAFPLHQPLATGELIDTQDSLLHLQQKKLQTCSIHSFTDDPLRLLKGVRHAVTLNLSLTPQTQVQMRQQAYRINDVAGERLRDELDKIFSSPRVIAGVDLLYATQLLAALFGPADPGWHFPACLDELQPLVTQLTDLRNSADAAGSFFDEVVQQAQWLLFAKLLRLYAPQNLSDLLHRKLRLSRHQQRLILALQDQPGERWLKQAVSVESDRQQALLVEQLGYAPLAQLLALSLNEPSVSLQRASQLGQSFRAQLRHNRIPDLLSGNELGELLVGQPRSSIGSWQQRLKGAEVAGEITSVADAKIWVKKQLSI